VCNLCFHEAEVWYMYMHRFGNMRVSRWDRAKKKIAYGESMSCVCIGERKPSALIPCKKICNLYFHEAKCTESINCSKNHVLYCKGTINLSPCQFHCNNWKLPVQEVKFPVLFECQVLCWDYHPTASQAPWWCQHCHYLGVELLKNSLVKRSTNSNTVSL
jgi:hypothetical protein